MYLTDINMESGCVEVFCVNCGSASGCMVLEDEQILQCIQHWVAPRLMTPGVKPVIPPTTMPVTMMNPAVAPIVSTVAQVPAEIAPPVNLPVKQWLGPPVNKAGCIAPVSAALASARRDPRLFRLVAPPTTPVAPQPIAPNVFDIKPLGRVTKRKNFITIDVHPDAPPVRHPRDPRRRDPRLNKRDDRQWRPPQQHPEGQPESYSILERLLEVKSIAKLPPIPKIQREREPDEEQAVVLKKKKDTRDERKKKKVKDSGSNSSSPEKKARSLKHSEAKEKEVPKDTKDKQKETPKEQRDKRRRERRLETEPEAPAPEEVVFKKLKNYRKDRCYMCRNRGKSGSPERPAADANKEAETSSVSDVVVENKDVDFRVLHPAVAEPKAAPVAQKRSSTELLDGKPKKSKIDKFDVLFGNEDVDLRQLPQVEELTAPPPPSLDLTYTEAIPAEDDKETSPETSTKKDWQDVKEKDEDNRKTPLKLDLVRAKLLRNINVNDLFAKLVATGIVQVPNEPKKKEKAEQKTEDIMKPKPKEDKNIIHRADLLKLETLRVKQPGLVVKLYGGMQCSGCGTRFPPEHTVRYSQHLDWHFRQNRRDRHSARRAHSRHWHYNLSDWLQYEEVEDLEEREKGWFETGGAEEGGVISTGGQLRLGDEDEVPSVAAGALTAHHCALCGDAFQQFYNEDKEEWHLRNSVRHEDKNYHPMCFDDYKLSLTKNVTPAEESLDDVVSVEKLEETIEIKDVDEDTNSQSDSESIVEVVEPMIEEPETVEIDEGDEDDVIYIAEPVGEVLVVDDADTDDETVATRAERDRLAQIDFSKIKVKQEPIDPDDEPVITAEESSPPVVDTTQASVQSFLDGNTHLEVLTARAPPTAIRINISKTGPTSPERRHEEETDEPPPPGEEPELEYTLKRSLVGLHLSRQPPVQRGSELSGLCSIM